MMLQPLGLGTHAHHHLKCEQIRLRVLSRGIVGFSKPAKASMVSDLVVNVHLEVNMSPCDCINHFHFKSSDRRKSGQRLQEITFV